MTEASQDESEPSVSLDRAQAERVLGRAAAMQIARADADISLADLGEAAQGAGIERALVVKAASELQLDLAEPPRTAGMQTRLVRRRWIDRRLGQREFERALARLDAFFGAQGARVIQTESASWTARHMHVTFEPQREGTMIQISERFVRTASASTTMGMLLGGSTAFNLVLYASIGFVAAPLLLAIPAAVLGGLAGLQIVRRRHAHRIEHTAVQFDQALDSIENSLSEFALASGPSRESP